MNVSWIAGLLAIALTSCGSESGLVTRDYIDLFVQVPTDQVDILFVVDNSTSMAEEQAALVRGFASFVRELEDAKNDFHIAVISTEQGTNTASAGVLEGDPPYLTRDDDYIEEFRRRARVGTTDSEIADKEKGLQAAVHALAPHMQIRENRGFLRDTANLLVVFVSDEDDCTDYGRLDGRSRLDCYTARDELIPVSNLVNRLQSYKANAEGRLQLSAIVGPFDGSCGDDVVPGYRYAEAVLSTGGTLDRICEDDWSAILEELGLNALGIVAQFKLTHAAQPATLVVRVDGIEIPESSDNGWTYDSVNWIIYFHGDAVPERGASISMSYEIAPYADVPETEVVTGTPADG